MGSRSHAWTSDF